MKNLILKLRYVRDYKNKRERNKAIITLLDKGCDKITVAYWFHLSYGMINRIYLDRGFNQ